MKFLVLSAMLLSLGLNAATKAEYYKNDGNTPPELLTEKDTTAKKPVKTTDASIMQEQQAPGTSETGILNSSGVTTDQMNTSPNNPPVNDEELLDDATLSTGRFHPTKPGEIQQQQEEDALDYSTTPQKRTTQPEDIDKKK